MLNQVMIGVQCRRTLRRSGTGIICIDQRMSTPAPHHRDRVTAGRLATKHDRYRRLFDPCLRMAGRPASTPTSLLEAHIASCSGVV